MVERPKVAVLGAGNGGRAIAAFLGSIGCDVKLFNRTPENIAIIKQLGGINLTYAPELEEDLFSDNIEYVDTKFKHEYILTPSERRVEEDIKQVFGRVNLISSEIEPVIYDRDVIMVAIPATGHKYIAEICAPYLRDGQTVILNPGRCFGALEFYKIIHDYFKKKGEKQPDINSSCGFI